jgi:hypothetical protein
MLPSPLLCGTAAVLALLCAAGPSQAQQQSEAPADPVARAAFEVLDKHCARCHQDGKLANRPKPAKNFGNILNLDEIAGNPQYVLRGNPQGSRLFKQIVDKEMPYDVMYEGASPDMTANEILALETWIKSLGTRTASCDAGKFVSNTKLIELMAADLEQLPTTRRKGTRYLTLAHLKNVCTDEAELKVYRQGAIKLINSLSRSSDVVRLETVDSDGTLLRVNLDDLGWTGADWNTVLGLYPYNTQPLTAIAAVLERATGTRLPYIRADWFAFNASRPGLYDKLVKLPRTFQELARQEGVDLAGDIKNLLVQRAATQKSGVSRNNRLIERHRSKVGYFWTSYDFGGNTGRQNLFEHPLGPEGTDAFQHDGGETIFSLPNGFQAYYLNNARGAALNEGPTNIVQDPTNKNLTVVNGISCMGCHDQGMRKMKDEVRELVLASRTFPPTVRETVAALYPPVEKMDAVIEEDAARFRNAMGRAGLDPTLKLRGLEMITALMKRYENDLDLTSAAAELGIAPKDFPSAAKDANGKLRILVRRLAQGSVPRDQFEAQFAALSADMTDDQPVPTGFTAANRPSADPDLTITSDRNAYKKDDVMVLTVLSTKDCFLTVNAVDEKDTASALFPNRFLQDNRIKANTPLQLPPPGAPYAMQMQTPGSEAVTAVCSDKPGPVDGLKHDFSRQAFTQTPNYSRSVARERTVGLVPVAPGQHASPKSPDAPREMFRTAIKVKVE